MHSTQEPVAFIHSAPSAAENRAPRTGESARRTHGPRLEFNSSAGSRSSHIATQPRTPRPEHGVIAADRTSQTAALASTAAHVGEADGDVPATAWVPTHVGDASPAARSSAHIGGVTAAVRPPTYAGGSSPAARPSAYAREAHPSTYARDSSPTARPSAFARDSSTTARPSAHIGGNSSPARPSAYVRDTFLASRPSAYAGGASSAARPSTHVGAVSIAARPIAFPEDASSGTHSPSRAGSAPVAMQMSAYVQPQAVVPTVAIAAVGETSEGPSAIPGPLEGQFEPLEPRERVSAQSATAGRRPPSPKVSSHRYPVRSLNDHLMQALLDSKETPAAAGTETQEVTFFLVRITN